MEILLFYGALLLAAVLAVCDFCRWAWGWPRRKARTSPPAPPSQEKARLNRAFLDTLAAVVLPWMYHAVLNWAVAGLTPGGREDRGHGTLLLLGFPLMLASLCLWIWGMAALVRFHWSKPDLQDRPRVVATWVLAVLWLILFPLSVARLLRALPPFD